MLPGFFIVLLWLIHCFGLSAVPGAPDPACTTRVIDAYLSNFSESICNSHCGDGVVNSIYESCDLGDDNTYTGSSGCNTDCRVDPRFRCTRYSNITLFNNTCTPICGDGNVTGNEQCDGVEGCGWDCKAQPGYYCDAAANLCSPKCGDGLAVGGETCDTGNNTDAYGFVSDACNKANCTAQANFFAATGSETVKFTDNNCGDGIVFTADGEECDPPGILGCGSNCTAETGYKCDRAGCSPVCGDGILIYPEVCDNVTGCDTGCRPDIGYSCINNICNPVCGDGLVIYPEDCDPTSYPARTGCDIATCRAKIGYECHQNVCTTTCGDFMRMGDEECDVKSFGCSTNCTILPGYNCSLTACAPICGDGRVIWPEECDPVKDSKPNPGCDKCRVATGYKCDLNNTCSAICGDGLVIFPEQCDHGFNKSRILAGCQLDCTVQFGFQCFNNVCGPICGDSLTFEPEECDSVLGCDANCRAAFGYSCPKVVVSTSRQPCRPICGDGVVIPPETCDSMGGLLYKSGCDKDTCLIDPGYECPQMNFSIDFSLYHIALSNASNLTQASYCHPICGDGNVIEPEECDSHNVSRPGCTDDCLAARGYACISNDCQPVCGDGTVIAPEECDLSFDTQGCKGCVVQPGFRKIQECQPTRSNRTATRDCTQCVEHRIYIPFPKSPYPFPSLEKYSARELVNLSFSACSHCEQGIHSYYIVNTDQEAPICVPRVFSLTTTPCSYACNGLSFVSPLESIAYLRTQLVKDDFLNQVIGAIFGPGVSVKLDDGKKRAESVVFTLQNCTNGTANSNFSASVLEVVAGIVRDIIPNASMLTNTIDGCSMETSSNSNGLPIGLIVGVSIAILLVIIVVIVIAVLIRNYYKHDLHKLPIEITWSFLNKLSHPWLWEYRGNKNSHYYIRKYAQGSDEYRRVTNNLVSFAGLSSLPILDIFAVYNPALATSFLNQYNVFLERKRNDPGQFFANGGYARQPEKMWVIEQFRRYALQFAWNEGEDAVPIVPIVPALHGSDLAIAEKIAQTGFASLSTLDDGYFGKGIYFTTSLNYSLPYAVNKQIPVVILSYINMGHPYPVTEDHKGPKSLLGKGLRSGYNSHFVITTNDGYVYDQSKYSVFNTTETPCNEIVVGQESQILPAFIICLDKAKSQESWSSWHEVLTKAEHRASKSFQDQDLQILNEVKIDLSNKFADVLLEERACRQGDRGPSSPRSPRYRPPTSPTSPRVMRNVSSANFSGIPLDTNDSSPTDDLHYQLLDS